MTKSFKIGFIIGSLRKEAYSRKLGQILQNLAPSTLYFDELMVDDLPYYNEDLDYDNPPASWLRFREQLQEMDGVIFITPEYNRSIPAVVKNALDVGSRPFGQSVWANKPALIVSLSMGPLGGYGCNQHLRQVVMALNMPLMAQPEAYIGKVQDLVANIEEANNQQFISALINAYADFVARKS